MYEFLYGIYSFIITGVDDFLVLALFYITFKDKFPYVIYGTFLGLLCVMMPAYLSAFTAENYLNVEKYINPNLVIAGVLLYLAFNLLKEYFDKNNENIEISDIKQKSIREVIILSGTTYFLNGLDDYVIYTSFYLKGNSGILFSLGIIVGLLLFGVLASYFGKKIVKMNIKRVKFVIALVIIIIAYVLIFNEIKSAFL